MFEELDRMCYHPGCWEKATHVSQENGEHYCDEHAPVTSYSKKDGALDPQDEFEFFQLGLIFSK